MISVVSDVKQPVHKVTYDNHCADSSLFALKNKNKKVYSLVFIQIFIFLNEKTISGN